MTISVTHMPTTPRRAGGRLRSLATYDFFPGFSARARRFLYNPLGVLFLAAATSLLCGFFLHAQGFVLAGGIVAVIGLGVIWPWLSLRGLIGTLTFECARTTEGEGVRVRLTLRNRLPWAVWGLAVRGGFGEEPNRPRLSPLPPAGEPLCADGTSLQAAGAFILLLHHT